MPDTTAPARAPSPALHHAFADALPELAVPWRAMRPEEPALLALNEALAVELGLEPAMLRDEGGIRFLLGNALPEGARPVAQVYAGHQFGSYVPRLGDGRALLLGELPDSRGRLRDVHLKGSGRTPFARADGFAAVGPMLREYLMGEAMHALGIPTTRALAVVATGRRVVRPGESAVLPGAVLVRVARSHLRVGTFQYARSTGDLDLLRRLADHAVERHYPRLAESEQPYLGLLEAVIEAQAELVASWMLVGFVHGVMNTDNTAISGETIDYGPCAFIDAYDPAAVFSSIDHRGRYAYGNQPAIALWNLTRFAETLLPLLPLGSSAGSRLPSPGDAGEGDGEPLPETDAREAERLALAALERFDGIYEAARLRGMRRKLGIEASTAKPLDDAALSALVGEMLDALRAARGDFTGFFRALAEAARGREDALREILGDASDRGDWLRRWLALEPDADAMDRANPVYIPRNHLVDEALAAATQGDLAPFERMLEVVDRPCEPRPGLESYARPAPPGSPAHVTFCGT